MLAAVSAELDDAKTQLDDANAQLAAAKTQLYAKAVENVNVEFDVDMIGTYVIVKDDIYLDGEKTRATSFWVSDTMFAVGSSGFWTLFDFRENGVYRGSSVEDVHEAPAVVLESIDFSACVDWAQEISKIKEGGKLPDGIPAQ